MKGWYGWVFIETDTWRATQRENYNDLTNSHDSKNVLKAKSIQTLLELINANPDKTAIEINKMYTK